MKDIRNSISHGDILFKMKYKDIDFFNKKFSIFNNLEKTEFIVKNVELNKNDLMKYQYPILFHPTNSDDSEWLAQLSDNIEILEILNKKYLEFCKQIQKDYKNYFGNDDNILLFGMGRPTNNNESIYQEDYLLSFKSEIYNKIDDDENEKIKRVYGPDGSLEYIYIKEERHIGRWQKIKQMMGKKKRNKEIIKKQRNKNRFGKMKEFFREINGKKVLIGPESKSASGRVITLPRALSHA